MRKSFLALVLSILALNVNAKITLPSIFGNGMVLQQVSKVKLWGKAKNNASVHITTSWNTKVYTTKADHVGNWTTVIATPSAGGPYTITFNDGEGFKLSDILIGEVWLCSGQSNMEMPVKGFGNQPILNSNEILMDADQPHIRLFRVNKNMSRQPLTQLDNQWEYANAQTVREFSAVGFQFAMLLQQKLKVPVGIIQSAYGGTDIEAWTTKESLAGFNDFKNPPDSAKIIKNDPAVLYNAMIHPIVGFTIKGAIWYQGENNRVNPQTYAQKMATMVKEWRQKWGIGEWPFYYVQIAPFAYKDNQQNIPLLYEAQAKAMQLIPNSGMVVSVDAGSLTTIHPPNKTIISKRLAYWALGNTYGKKGITYSSPTYKSLKITAEKAVLDFNDMPLGLTAYDQKLIGFEVAGDDKIFHPADAVITGRTVVVKSEHVKNPVAVRYAYKDRAFGNLYSVEGLPLAPFRTDNW